jgi:hypothetical protein
MAGPDGVKLAGSVISVEKEVGEQLIKTRQAEKSKKEKIE